jgi:glutathione S-transferase
MDAFAVAEARQRLSRWIEDGQSVLGVMPWLFDEHERLRTANETAERECMRLQRELAALRAETDFLIGERSEVAELIAAGLNKVMNDALQRLRSPFSHPAEDALPHETGEPGQVLQPTYS